MAGGTTESFLAEALVGLRDTIVLVSKAHPQNAGPYRRSRIDMALPPHQVALAWVVRSGDVFAIGKRPTLRTRVRTGPQLT